MLNKVLISIFAFAFANSAKAAIFDVDAAHSAVKFEVTHLAISTVEGRFDNFNGTLMLSDDNKTVTAIKGEVDAATINTNNKKRDDHLRTEDFFDTKKYPKLSFEASGLKAAIGKESEAKGKLTMHGVTKEIPFKITFKGTGLDPYGGTKAAVVAKSTISRKDFGLTWNKALETGGVVVSDAVDIIVMIEANKQEAKKAEEKKK